MNRLPHVINFITVFVSLLIIYQRLNNYFFIIYINIYTHILCVISEEKKLYYAKC